MNNSNDNVNKQLNKAINIGTKSTPLSIKSINTNKYISKINNDVKKPKIRFKIKDKKKLLLSSIIVFSIILVLLLLSLIFSSPEKIKNVKVNEKNYLTMLDDIYTNFDNYKGKTITIEGMFKKYDYKDTTYFMVYRKTPGDSGNNGIAGIDFDTKNNLEFNENDWIKVTGTLTSYKDEEDNTYIKIIASKVEKVEEDKKGNAFIIE